MAPRIYNLFPTLAGPIARWPEHLERISRMGFDWVYVNPITRTGGSKSLYAVADYYELDERVRGDATESFAELVRGFVAAARARGLDVMFDLVMNHTADDAPLVEEHPDWYERDEHGAIVAPSAVDPDDTAKVTVWGDLAALDYREGPQRAEIVRYFSDVVSHYASLGVRGFRCDAAYKVPAPVWAELIATTRETYPASLFVAETLGCSEDEVVALGHAGFDLLFNSAKWWDFRAPWLLEQYERFRHIAPSIAFPESHDTPRLAAELGALTVEQLESEYRFRYLFAAVFSTGVMMPIGYEYGFEKPLDVVRTSPADWETPKFDLTDFIARANALKNATPALAEEGAQRLITAPDAVPLALVREAVSERDYALLLINPQAQGALAVGADRLLAALDGEAAREVSPDVAATASLVENARVDVPPRSIRVFATARHSEVARDGAVARNGNARAAVPVAPSPRIVVVENVTPQVDGGRFPIKRVVGDIVAVEADVFRDGHDLVAGVVRSRERGASRWRETPLAFIENDRYGASFAVDRNVPYEYAVQAWPDVFGTWVHDVEKKRDAGQAIALELIEGRALADASLARALDDDRTTISTALAAFDAAASDDERASALLAADVVAALERSADRASATSSNTFAITVDRRAARFGAWYEFFPRSAGTQPGVHGTFTDAIRRLPAIRAMSFDIVYLPPIHPIGHAFRKGPNNTLGAGPDDPGSPWAIGNEHGGHMAVEPKLGTLEDFDRFVAAANAQGLEVALDYALQCSPDHPYLREHPEWFVVRPDGTIKYAENPPKKYQDIVNFNWFGPHATALWNELRDIVEFWIARGVKIFRVDNPHTKPFAFWEWMIGDVQARHPETIFLAEAFTRPKIMRELAKCGFTQSYTYFTWRNTKAELTEYLEELAQTEMGEYYRPNFFANTPDILPPILQTGGRAAFAMRLFLAATLSSTYGIYSGFELCESAALPGREEYADSEKYQIRVRDWTAEGNLDAEIARINRIRHEHAALHDWRNVEFLRSSDDDVIAYMKPSDRETLLCVVNLDPHATHETWLHVPLWRFGLADDAAYEVEDLLRGGTSTWYGRDQHLVLDPAVGPAILVRMGTGLKVARGSVD